jgi:2-(1,2-epoxy-1,2-dihydrophenyl)acetyl-CoA isomerase
MLRLTTMDYRVSDGVAHLRFTRPDEVNSVSSAFAADLRQVMLEVEFDDKVRAVSVTAEGKVFCAGGDLKTFRAAGEGLPAMAAALLADLNVAILRMNSIPKPFVAGVRGAAGGGGLALVGAFDLVVAAESAKFTMAYTKAGLTPDASSSHFLARHIGLRRTLDLVLTNRVLSAAEALEWGLVNRVVADDQVDETTAALAQELADGADRALGNAKRLVYRGCESSLAESLELEEQTMTTAMKTEHAKEGILAFAERRAPRFEKGDQKSPST